MQHHRPNVQRRVGPCIGVGRCLGSRPASESRHAGTPPSDPYRFAGRAVIGALTVAVSAAGLLLATCCGYATAWDQSTKEQNFRRAAYDLGSNR
jgi:hypothetical protein